MRPALREAARRLGYRPMPSEGEPQNHAHVWGKPVGYSLMLISETEIHGIEWMQWFHNGSESVLWTRKVFEEEPHQPWYAQTTMQMFLCWIKDCENWDQKACWAGDHRSSFEFLTLTQTLVDA